jgi:Ca2+/Na+ antiporter
VVPIPVSPASMGVDFGMMLGTAVLLAVFLAWNRRLSRLEGAVLVLVYLGCTWFLYS